MTPAVAEFVEFLAGGPSQTAVADFRASEAVSMRVAHLIRRQKAVGLSEVESSELAQSLPIEHLMRLAKALARQRLESAG